MSLKPLPLAKHLKLEPRRPSPRKTHPSGGCGFLPLNKQLSSPTNAVWDKSAALIGCAVG
jgi:hypothetical protein